MMTPARSGKEGAPAARRHPLCRLTLAVRIHQVMHCGSEAAQCVDVLLLPALLAILFGGLGAAVAGFAGIAGLGVDNSLNSVQVAHDVSLHCYISLLARSFLARSGTFLNLSG
jgi:hypothetical protein